MAWLAGRVHAEHVEDAYCDVRCDGWSAFVDADCLATWQPGPRRLYDPDVALVSDRRLRAGSFQLPVRYGFTSVLEEWAVPMVRLVLPYPCPYDYEPKQLADGRTASQAIIHLVATRAHEPAMRDLVWAWVRGDAGANYRIDCHHCYLYENAVYAASACLRASLQHRGRVALFSAHRSPGDATPIRPRRRSGPSGS